MHFFVYFSEQQQKSTQVHKQTNMHEGYGLVWTYHYNVAMSHLT